MRRINHSHALRALTLLMALVLVAVATVAVDAKGPPAGKGPKPKPPAGTTYTANCDTSGWRVASVANGSDWVAVIPRGSTVNVTSTVTGGAWQGDCPNTLTGTTWLPVTAVNGTSTSSLYGLAQVYFAAGFFTQGSGGSSYLEGVDISHHQGSVNFTSVKGAGKSFVIAKASEGWGYTDPMWSTYRSGAQAAGLAVTGYHFARPDLNPTEAAVEAEWFASVVNMQHGMLIPALDLEVNNSSLGVSGMQTWVRTFLDRFYQLTGIRAMIYTSPNFWGTVMGDSRWFADNGYSILWVAHWTSNSQPTVPAQNWGGRGWTFWQYTNCGSVSGISGCVDLDRFNGTSLSSVTW